MVSGFFALLLDPIDFPIFEIICRWGAYENQQKSRNRQDPTFTLQYHVISRKMRSEGWMRSISRFFTNFTDGEPTKINKNRGIDWIQPSLCNSARCSRPYPASSPYSDGVAGFIRLLRPTRSSHSPPPPPREPSSQRSRAKKPDKAGYTKHYSPGVGRRSRIKPATPSE